MRGGLVVVVLGVWSWGCTPSKPASEAPARKAAAPASEPAPAGAVLDAPEPAAPPALHLEVLEERLALGLSIQNRGAEPVRFDARVRLVGEGRDVDVPLSKERDCLSLRPGGEYLWPADWGQTLAPDQTALDGLEGSFHFEVTGCEDGKSLASRPVVLPVRYR